LKAIKKKNCGCAASISSQNQTQTFSFKKVSPEKLSSKLFSSFEPNKKRVVFSKQLTDFLSSNFKYECLIGATIVPFVIVILELTHYRLKNGRKMLVRSLANSSPGLVCHVQPSQCPISKLKKLTGLQRMWSTQSYKTFFWAYLIFGQILFVPLVARW
jgi:hypothetical protein